MGIVKLGWEETIGIRHTVLWPDERPEFCKVPGDEAAEHYGVVVEGNLVCVASLFATKEGVRLRKFATLPAYQGQGIGSNLLKSMMATLSERGVSTMWFDARESALPFYSRFGFATEGDRFFKKDVPYFVMRRAL